VGLLEGENRRKAMQPDAYGGVSAGYGPVAGPDREPPMWILLLLPFIGLLWVPLYNFEAPALFGFPFFYWYQLAWVPISSLLIWLVYRSRKPDEAP
jgi:Protein of unknown function (DUF3311)